MENISCDEAASELLRRTLAGQTPDERLIAKLAADDCSAALFRILVEGLADRFEERLCPAYVEIFAGILDRVLPELRSRDLVERYRSVRQASKCGIEPRDVFVLSRVTLGADVAITSVVLDGVKRRFPHARIHLAGSRKSADLFAADPRIRHFEVEYSRGGLRDRLESWRRLAADLPHDGAIVVDPDSRLTQLGLLPVCPDDKYFFFESRSYGGSGLENLTALTQRWMHETFDVDGARNKIAPAMRTAGVVRPFAAVSLGTGGNSDKQLTPEFEIEWIKLLRSRFETVIVDRGGTSEESDRVNRAIAGTGVRAFNGSFAAFASLIAQADCFTGYDSAGQHAAAALGTPLLTLFKGFVSDRMFARWQPGGFGRKRVLRVEGTVALDEVATSLTYLRTA